MSSYLTSSWKPAGLTAARFIINDDDDHSDDGDHQSDDDDDDDEGEAGGELDDIRVTLVTLIIAMMILIIAMMILIIAMMIPKKRNRMVSIDIMKVWV